MDIDTLPVSNDSSLADRQMTDWSLTRKRLLEKQLLGPKHGGLSLRIPGTTAIWFGNAASEHPLRAALTEATSDATLALHCRIYQHRPDITAIGTGAGPFGEQLYLLNGRMPGLFDEQVRHLGQMADPVTSTGSSLAAALASGSNALAIDGLPMVFGMTSTRLVLNAELLEKCAKAYVLAAATGMPTHSLPWLVRFIAHRRLRKDQQRAQRRVAAGHLPEESKGY